MGISCSNRSEPFVPTAMEPPVILPPVLVDTISCNGRAKEIFDLSNLYYKLPNGLYFENSPAQSGDPTYSYLWPYVGLVSGAATLNQIGYTVDIATLTDNYEKYFRTGANGNNISGNGSSTNGTTGGGTGFYDDNSIVGVSQLEAYNFTKEHRFIDRSSLIVTFLKSGVDHLLGGAMWWNEDEKYGALSVFKKEVLSTK